MTKTDLTKKILAQSGKEPALLDSSPQESEQANPTDLQNLPNEQTDIDRGLNDKQLKAIDLIISGKTDPQIAKSLAISRQTICRWRNHHPAFIAELNSRREALLSASADRLRRLTTNAIDVLEEEIDSYQGAPYRQRAAVHILRAVGLYGKPALPLSQRNRKAAGKALVDFIEHARIQSLEKARAQSPELKQIETETCQAIADLIASSQTQSVP